MSDYPSILHKFRIFIVTLFLAALSVLFAPSSAVGVPAQPWGDTRSEDYYVIVSASDGVNIRESPGVNYQKLAFASPGTRLHVIGSTINENGKPWLKIESPSGWAAASEVTNERDYRPPAPATTKPAPTVTVTKSVPTVSSSAPAPAESNSEPSAPKTATSTAKAPSANPEQFSPDSGSGMGVLIVLVLMVVVICAIAILLLYRLFVRGKENQQEAISAEPRW